MHIYVHMVGYSGLFSLSSCDSCVGVYNSKKLEYARLVENGAKSLCQCSAYL